MRRKYYRNRYKSRSRASHPHNSDFVEGLTGVIILLCILGAPAAIAFFKQIPPLAFIILAGIVVVCLVIWISLKIKKTTAKQKAWEQALEESQKKYERAAEEYAHWDSQRLEEYANLEQQDADNLQKQMTKYRKIFGLPDDTPLFPVYSAKSGAFSTYPVETTDGENFILGAVLNRFNPFCVFADVYIKKPDGKTTQIDLIAISKRGVIVFESKDYNGWIFGNANNQKWTQLMAYGHKKYQFYNPVKQNASHIAALKKVLNNPKIKFFSVIVFGADTEIKNADFIPQDCFVATAQRIEDVIFDISAKDESLTSEVVLKIARNIQQSIVKPNEISRKKHIDEIEDMTGAKRVYR